MRTHQFFSRAGAGIRALLLVFAAAVTMHGGALSAQTVQDAVLAIENHYKDVADLTATVSQRNELKAIGKTQKFDGTLQIKKPGKLRLDYTNGQLIVVNGSSALFYSKKSSQVVKKTFTDFEHMNIPVAFLLGAAHIRDDFDVLQPDPKAPRRLELLPQRSGAAMKKMLLTADEAGRITELEIVDRSGNISVVVFRDIRENSGPSDSLFTFTPPKGTEIIE